MGLSVDSSTCCVGFRDQDLGFRVPGSGFGVEEGQRRKCEAERLRVGNFMSRVFGLRI